MGRERMWDGRFSTRTAQSVQEFTESIEADRQFYRQDILCSKVHASMLANQGIIQPDEASAIIDGLEQVQAEIEDGRFQWRRDLEDVHMNIESRLTEIVGPVGKKLHTGRSRNDQVAADFRVFVSERLQEWDSLLVRLIDSLRSQAESHQRTILPGYTHLQPAQPVTLAHHLLAYVQMARRDSERIHDCQQRVRVSPLGAAALGGTTYAIDPEAVASGLGFAETFENSMDAVSDRDFVLEALFIAGLIMTHLSRLCEEIILWANPNFGFVRLPDAFATGSSIMPQKKNPDIPELVRGKAGRVFGDLLSLFVTLKGLPLAYNRDLQEDKPCFLDADKTVCDCLYILSGMLELMEFDSERMRRATTAGFLNATELADYLASQGIPFRQAHHIAGQTVAFAETKGVGLEELSLQELQQFSPLIAEDVYGVLDYESAVNRRRTLGGTGFDSVSKQLTRVETWLAERRQAEKESGGSV